MIVSIASLAVLMLVTGPPAAPEGGTASLTIVVDDGGTKVHNTGNTWVSVTPNNAGKTQVVGPGSKADFSSGPDVGQARPTM